MITQPLMMTPLDATGKPLAPGSAVTGAKGVAEDFQSLLGLALPGKETQALGNEVTLEPALSKSATKSGQTNDDQAALAALLGKLDKPETLPEPLSDVKKTATSEKSLHADATDEQAPALSDTSLQALSALFAMLPPKPPASVAADNLADKDLSISLGGKSPLAANRGQNTLSFEASDSQLTLDKGAALSPQAAAKSTFPTAEQNVDAKPLALSNIDAGKQGDSAANNTTLASQAVPTFSSATLAAPASTQIAVPVAPQISAQLGSQEWQQSVSQHITLFTRQGQQSAELRLHPEDLGQIQISMKLDDNQAQIQMVSAHNHVRAALEAALPTLRTALAESGIQLGQSNISHESFAQQQQSSNQTQQQAPHQGGAFPSMGSDGETFAAPASVQRMASGNNAVDIFA